MKRLAVAALVLAACGTDVDERPRNLDYITEAILAPSCGAATCHSSFRGADSFVFDTVDGARATFQHDDQLIPYDDEDQTKTPGLVLNLTLEQSNAPRMPYNAPLPDADVELISDWLRHGAPGVCNGVRACLGEFSVECTTARFLDKYTENGAYKLADLYERFTPPPTAADPMPKARLRNLCTLDGLHCIDGECQ